MSGLQSWKITAFNWKVGYMEWVPFTHFVTRPKPCFYCIFLWNYICKKKKKTGSVQTWVVAFWWRSSAAQTHDSDRFYMMAAVEVSEAEKVYILHGIRVRFLTFIIRSLIRIWSSGSLKQRLLILTCYSLAMLASANWSIVDMILALRMT